MLLHPIVRRIVLAALTLVAVAGVGWGQAPQSSAKKSVALIAAIEGPIGPGMVRYVENVFEAAREQNADFVILRLNTPGGLVTATREIISQILGSPVPVVGWVAPPGGHAASAGTFILYATHIAAMAPGTNIGAATPVQIGGFPGLPKGDGEPGGDKENKNTPGDTLTAKSTNDAVAFIRGLAEMHGRNADWAEKAVREAATLTAKQALEMHVIDVIAEDQDALLAAIDGKVVTAGGKQQTLASKGATVEPVEPGALARLLNFLSDPNVAFILLMIGVYGLIFEFANPGSIGPGVVGVICLVLGLYALNQLPLDYAGLALLIVGIGLMVAEALTPTFGVLGIGGLVAFVIGATFLIDTEIPAYQLSWWVIGGTAAASGGVLILLLGYVWRVYRRPGWRAANDMIGTNAEVVDWSDGEGHVWAQSARWKARGDVSLTKGQTVRISGLDGLTLVVDGAEPSGDKEGASTQPENEQKGG